MVIERAIEKLKKTGGLPDQDSRLRARAREAISPSARGSAAIPPPAQRLSFPSVALDSALLERNRIIDPSPTAPRTQPGQAAFRILRSRMLNKVRSEGWRTLAVTSPGPGEGKTLVSINLALSMSREGASDVFLLDLDMRNPSVCRYLGIEPRREIAEYFQGTVEPQDLFFSAGSERLSIAGGTMSTDMASEFVASHKFEDLIAYIQSVAYNPVVLIDLPPMLASDEAIVLAPRVDALTLVIAEGRTDRDGLERTRQMLEGHTLAGIVLNRSSDRLSGSDYYGYGYGSAQGGKP